MKKTEFKASEIHELMVTQVGMVDIETTAEINCLLSFARKSEMNQAIFGELLRHPDTVVAMAKNKSLTSGMIDQIFDDEVLFRKLESKIRKNSFVMDMLQQPNLTDRHLAMIGLLSKKMEDKKREPALRQIAHHPACNAQVMAQVFTKNIVDKISDNVLARFVERYPKVERDPEFVRHGSFARKEEFADAQEA